MTALLLLAGLALLLALLLMALLALQRLRARVLALELAVDRLRQGTSTVGSARAERTAPLAPTRRTDGPAPDELAAAASSRAPAPRPSIPPVPPGARPAPEPASDRLAATVRRWFTEGNVPVKVGVLVLLAGVAALLKYASDQGWLALSIGARLALVAAAALGALAFAWRRRRSHRSFALAVQGGAIGVLLLVVFAAFRLHGLLDAGPAFALSVALVAALGTLAVLQEARTLAVFGILAGFLAPLWLSSGAGNHVVLFSYYALLNGGIFAIAWLRAWRELNLLGWVFTWGIGVAWGLLEYEPADRATTQPFLLLFFAFYLLLPVLYARRRAPGRRDIVDGSLVFGTPLVAFLLQAALLEGVRRPLALCALGLALVYAVLAWWQRRGPHAVLAEAHALLAGGFAILAAPLALSARATAAVFAVEGAALVWLGLRQDRRLSRWTGAGLQVAAAIAFLVGAAEVDRPEAVVANPAFAGALLIAVAGFASAWSCRAMGRPAVAALFYAWGLAWWGGNLLEEVSVHVRPHFRSDGLLAATAVTLLLAARVHRHRPASALAATVTGGILLAALLVLEQAAARGQPLAGLGAAAWVLFALCGLRALVDLREGGGAVAPSAQFAWVLLWPLVFSLAAAEAARAAGLGESWRAALAGLPWLLLAWLLQARWALVRWPLGAAGDGVRAGLLWACLSVLGIGWLLALRLAGDATPLPWWPLLDPLDLAQLVALALSARLMRSPVAPDGLASNGGRILATAGFLLATCITLRTVHHWGGVAWGTPLWSSSLGQTALTVAWSVMGMAAWIAGSRRGLRGLWLAGAVLMAVVLAKLVLVDRHHLGNLLGIGSFMAFGVLCILVGWFAPAPPRNAAGDRGHDPGHDPGHDASGAEARSEA